MAHVLTWVFSLCVQDVYVDDDYADADDWADFMDEVDNFCRIKFFNG